MFYFYFLIVALNVNIKKCKNTSLSQKIIDILRSYNIRTFFKVYQGKGLMPILPYQMPTKRLIFNIMKCKNGNLHFLFSWLSSKKSLLHNAIQLMQYVISWSQRNNITCNVSLSLVSLWAFHRIKHASDFTTIEIQRLKLLFSTKDRKDFNQ